MLDREPIGPVGAGRFQSTIDFRTKPWRGRDIFQRRTDASMGVFGRSHYITNCGTVQSQNKGFSTWDRMSATSPALG